MRDFQSVMALFSKIPGVQITEIEPLGNRTEVSIKRGNITAKFTIPTEGSEVEIDRLLAEGGRRMGGGEGRKLVDDVMESLGSVGVDGLRVVTGSEFWDKQPDFKQVEGGIKITHIKKW